ncbi:beta-ketoacyl-[acyl-carrier-protein] synthase family protein [Roseateles albus]|uniref:Nodulation protein E n=1 Tax=Roseateles albus TaxID=2987525 RepID=A0ABT5KHN4_9BURK|nr:beta-ketoacyl-[acyl-carrier-protein] synthase family protein [Roseateles albus]MDC8773044.1 beta-ketoacyl-[acyl-carrier-protein] synthase family protein [Roseateles albus]
MRRVAVTGIGVVSPLGNSAMEVLANARAGHSGVRQLAIPFASRLSTPIAAVANFNERLDFEPGKARMLDRFSLFALFAANQAMQASNNALAGFDSERAGVFVGTGMGGTLSMDEGYQTLYGEQSDRIKPFTILMGMHNAAAAWIGIEYGLRGPNMTYSTACSSSAVAIGEAWMRVACGQLDIAIAGGAEAPLSPGSLKAWEALHTVATLDALDPAASCRPFSKNRSGMVLGEGAAMLVLEPWDRAKARGADIVGEILGYGQSNDASHITRPSVEGQVAAINAALRAAGVDRQEVDAINAHGTGTQANDRTETAAIRSVFGARADQIPISATKAIHGHLLGAAGALECVLSLLAMKHQVALPTMHLQMPDPECDLDYVANVAREGSAARLMLSNSFAFGGTNAVLVLRSAG